MHFVANMGRSQTLGDGLGPAHLAPRHITIFVAQNTVSATPPRGMPSVRSMRLARPSPPRSSKVLAKHSPPTVPLQSPYSHPYSPHWKKPQSPYLLIFCKENGILHTTSESNECKGTAVFPNGDCRGDCRGTVGGLRFDGVSSGSAETVPRRRELRAVPSPQLRRLQPASKPASDLACARGAWRLHQPWRGRRRSRGSFCCGGRGPTGTVEVLGSACSYAP